MWLFQRETNVLLNRILSSMGSFTKLQIPNYPLVLGLLFSHKSIWFFSSFLHNCYSGRRNILILTSLLVSALTLRIVSWRSVCFGSIGMLANNNIKYTSCKCTKSKPWSAIQRLLSNHHILNFCTPVSMQVVKNYTGMLLTAEVPSAFTISSGYFL